MHRIIIAVLVSLWFGAPACADEPLHPALAAWAGERGANDLTKRRIVEANTATEALNIALQQGVPLAQVVADKARDVAVEHVNGKVAIEVLVYDRDAKLVGAAGAFA